MIIKKIARFKKIVTADFKKMNQVFKANLDLLTTKLQNFAQISHLSHYRDFWKFQTFQFCPLIIQFNYTNMILLGVFLLFRSEQVPNLNFWKKKPPRIIILHILVV